MCGINGIIQFKKQLSRDKLIATISLMNKQIIHRGPDAEGKYVDDKCALGMRRLSIIDLKTGNQPIWNETHDKMIVFNGEIYNYIKLRAELKELGHRFNTESDTEVVLHGFESFGIDFFKKLEGMYAFIIYDVKNQKWIVCRDRIGEKPLYYFYSNEYMIIGSELKSLVSTGLFDVKINNSALSAYLQLTYIPAPMSIIDNVYKLNPASLMIIDANGAIQCNQYWELAITEKYYSYSYEDCKKILREKMFNAVEARMVSDVPIGAFLSGGFDSSIIVGIMAKISANKINTFTIGFDDKQYDESLLANVVANKNFTNHHILTLNEKKLLEDSKILFNNMDEPFADSSLIATYACSYMAKQHVSVVLNGDAGDELFAGYNKYLIAYYGAIYEKLPTFLKKILKRVVKLLPSDSSFSRKMRKVVGASGEDIFSQRKKLMCLGFNKESMRQLANGLSLNDLAFIQEQYNRFPQLDDQSKTQYVDLKTVLEGDMLVKVDRASMLASLETRVPMLDSSVVDFAFNIPTNYKINKKNRKIILKDTFKDLLPAQLYRTKKHGFAVPIGKWLREEFKDELVNYSDKDFLCHQGIFNYKYVQKIIDLHLEKRIDFSSELWTFFVFQNWYERMLGF